MPMTKKEIAATLADRDWWQEIDRLVGWQLLGWTYRHGATFVSKSDGFEQTVQLTGGQRDDIVRACKR